METVLHIYHPKRQLLLLEYANKGSSSSTNANANISSQPLAQSTSTAPTNVLLFVGGMYDVFRSPSYIEDLAALFPRDIPGQKWRVMHVQLSSSGKCFGLYDLDRDVSCNIYKSNRHTFNTLILIILLLRRLVIIIVAGILFLCSFHPNPPNSSPASLLTVLSGRRNQHSHNLHSDPNHTLSHITHCPHGPQHRVPGPITLPSIPHKDKQW